MSNKVNLLGYSISASGLTGDVSRAWQLIKSGAVGHYVACINPHSLVVACSDDYFESSLKNADILLPDGIGIILAANILKINLRERVAGSEFFHELSNKANKNGGLKYFFLGSTEEVLDKIRLQLKEEFPNITVCGMLSPPFKSEFSQHDNELIIKKINDAKPDVLWVGMTAPKQEKWIFQNKDKLNVPLMGAIGAVFDFYAGTKQRSPEWVCKIGLEWLPRLMREPRRLFKRNFISSPLFLMMVFQNKFRIGKGK